MKKFLSIALAAVMAMTILVIPASAAETGYWSFTGVKFYTSVNGTVKLLKSGDSWSETTSNSLKISDSVVRDADNKSGTYQDKLYYDTHYKTGTGFDMYGQTAKGNVTWTEPPAYICSKEKITIQCGVTASRTSDWINGSASVSIYLYNGKFDTADYGSIANSIGEFRGEDKDGSVLKSIKASTDYAKGNSAFASGRLSAEMADINSSTVKKTVNIIVSLNGKSCGAKAVYEYVWKTGTPPADDGAGIWTITLKKGAPAQLGIDTSGKVTYSTSKKSVAAITSSGKVTAKAKGTAIITAKCGSSTLYHDRS